MSEATDRKVVVTIRCSTRHDEENDNFVAHFTDLGLVARGQSEEEAINNCKQLFNGFIHAYRKHGGLVQRLERSGAPWCWEDEYPNTEPPPEDTDLLMPGRVAETLPPASLLELWDSGPREFAIAA